MDVDAQRALINETVSMTPRRSRTECSDFPVQCAGRLHVAGCAGVRNHPTGHIVHLPWHALRGHNKQRALLTQKSLIIFLRTL